MVVNIGKKTILGQMTELSQEVRSPETFISKEMNLFIRHMLYFAILVGIAAFSFAITIGYH